MNEKRGKWLGLALAALLAALAPAAEPALRFEKILGDARGRSLDNLGVALAEDGSAWLLMASGRVAEFGPDGAYRRSLEARLPWPQDHKYLAAQGKLVLVGDSREDYPWVYAVRRQGSAPGAFAQPGPPVEDAAGRVYVPDSGNKRIQVFAPDQIATPELVLPLPARPLRLAVREDRLAVADDRGQVAMFVRTGESFAPAASAQAGPNVKALGLAPDGALFVVFAASLRRYAPDLRSSRELAPACRGLWPNFFAWDVGLVPGPGGELYFASDREGKLLALDPATDQIRERGALPDRTRAIAFAPDGSLLSAHVEVTDGDAIVNRYSLGPNGLSKPEPFRRDPLYRDRNVPVWGLLPAADGSILVRVVEFGHHRKGWPALNILRVGAEGKPRPFHDFGYLYAVRSTCSPWEYTTAMRFDGAGNVILAAGPLVAVCKLAPDGTLLWEAGREPQGGADRIEFGAPRELAVDSQGDIWVTDAAKDQVLCLSAAGKLRSVYGRHAGVDDLAGTGFDHPSGIAAAVVAGQEFLYVGDTGNQRLLKFRILRDR